MNTKDILTYSDFFNLTKNELDKIGKECDIILTEDIVKQDYYYQIRNILFSNNVTEKLILNRVLAGRTSIKWFKFKIKDEVEKQKIINKLQSEENCYDDILEIDTNNLRTVRRYTCIKTDEERYLMRVYVPAGTKTVNDGRSIKKFTTVNNIVIIIDIGRNFIEVRSNSKDAKKIADIVCEKLGIEMYDGARILNKYHNSIEELRDSLFNGKFIDTTSVPDENIALTKNDSEALANVLMALDEYFINKDMLALSDQLSTLNIDSDGVPFTQLFLAGMSKIGMTVRPDAEEDLSFQSLYAVLKSYITNHKGFITFSTPEDGLTHTIQIGITTNSISFTSSVTEDVINYIREKIL
ncbi:hypothetical protein [Clostridium sp. FP1]|uniref:hypothetical protein n=1 Tax=Clostridium sp. FP1 TaxID=2724076 RepID=UPI0013E8FF80|nr:hypothetical protein [Clostridium sp. FP1]MBZ9635568.1 hypothetical protein [Clostridium sp. FP1]